MTDELTSAYEHLEGIPWQWQPDSRRHWRLAMLSGAHHGGRAMRLERRFRGGDLPEPSYIDGLTTAERAEIMEWE